MRGVSRSSRTLERDAVAQVASSDERRFSRTAESCGPDISTLISNLQGDESCRRWWQESPITRESAKETVKTIRVRECRAIRCVPAVTYSCGFILSTRGCGCARHPAFPTPSVLGGWNLKPKLARKTRREREPAFFNFNAHELVALPLQRQKVRRRRRIVLR